jgi:hypothetical protein
VKTSQETTLPYGPEDEKEPLVTESQNIRRQARRQTEREREGGKSKRRKCRKKTMTFVTESNSSQEQRTQTEALWERIFSAHTQFLLFEFTTCVCSFFDGRAVGLSMCASICVMFRFAVCVCVFWCYLGMGFWRAAD